MCFCVHIPAQGEKAEEDNYMSEDLYQEPNAFRDASRGKDTKSNVRSAKM